jgi:hypothetical protein
MEYSADKSVIRRNQARINASEYYRRNREKILEKQKLYEAEKRKQMSEERREELKEYNAQYYLKMIQDGRRSRTFVAKKRKEKVKKLEKPKQKFEGVMEMERVGVVESEPIVKKFDGSFVLEFD